MTLGGRLVLLHNEKDGTFKDRHSKPASTIHLSPLALHLSTTITTAISICMQRGTSEGIVDEWTEEVGFAVHVPAAKMYRNNWRRERLVTWRGRSVSMVTTLRTVPLESIGTDYNNDRAVDLGRHQRRSGRFSRTPVKESLSSASHGQLRMPAPTVGVAVLDFNHDGWMDIAFTHMGEPGLSLWRNNKAKSFDRVDLPNTNWVRVFGVAAFDYDNDGWVDLVAVGETKDGKGEVRLFRNLGPDGFKDVTADVGLDKIQLKDPRAIITGDYDNDGAIDLLITQNHGPAVLLRNEGGNKNNWLRLNLKGLNDNKSAIGTKVEVFAGANRQKFEIYGSSGYLGQNSPYLTVGLGQAKQADVVRMLWPTGVLQDEIEVAANREQPYLELDRRGSSCPTLFVWDGHHYELVGDMIGAGVVGHWVGPNERNVPRPGGIHQGRSQRDPSERTAN